MKSIQSAVFVMMILTFTILQSSIAKATDDINNYAIQAGKDFVGSTLSNLSAAIKTTPLSLNVSGGLEEFHLLKQIQSQEVGSMHLQLIVIDWFMHGATTRMDKRMCQLVCQT